jgi:hypothetical protein
MAKRHKHASASATVTTHLDPSTIAKVAELAAKEAESLQVMVRLEESTPGRLIYSTRNRVVGGRVEFMTFEVTLKESDDNRTINTRILRYKQKRQWFIVIPLPWQMIGWGTYRKFMYGFVSGLKAEDPQAVTSVIEAAAA